MTTTPFLLRIPNDIHQAMLAHARAELPAECCGLLAGGIGSGGTVAEVTHRYPLINELASPTEFLSTAASMFAADRAMRKEGVEILAVYHSHPSTAPIPSRRDLERNYSVAVMSLIIGLAGSAPEVRAWWLTEREYREGEWQVC